MFGTNPPFSACWLAAGAACALAVTPAAAQRAPGGPQAPQMGPQMSRSPQMSRIPAPPREVSDQDHARSRMRSGENRSFEDLLGSARRVGRGEFIAVEPDISTNIYRFKFMRPTGNMVWVDVDGRTGRVIAERE